MVLLLPPRPSIAHTLRLCAVPVKNHTKNPQSWKPQGTRGAVQLWLCERVPYSRIVMPTYSLRWAEAEEYNTWPGAAECARSAHAIWQCV
eukprot:scaffold109812_cov41-Tisochrysis_lutea.AAC.4